MHFSLRSTVLFVLLSAALAFISTSQKANAAAPSEYFGLHFIDADTGRGIPMVQAQTQNKVRYYSDSAGYLAYDEPGLMNQRIYFDLKSYGYEPGDVGFGMKGTIQTTAPGTIVDVKLKRTNIAERLYRMTGQGIYRDSVLLGKPAPISHPLLNGRVMGQDTVETVIYKGKMLWCWGDTDKPDFPLGMYDTPGAISKLPAELDLEKGIDFTYFTQQDGFVRGMIKSHYSGSRPVWIDGMMNVPDSNGHEKLLARYVATKNLVPVERGLLLFDDATQMFNTLKVIPLDPPLDPGGHPMRALVDGKEYYYFPDPYPTKRVLADYQHASDVTLYEGLTCMKPGDPQSVNRDSTGKLLWTWQVNVKPVGPKEIGRLISSGQIKDDESPYGMRDVATGKSLYVSNGGVAWDAWAKKWVMVFGQLGGTSNLGEIYVAFAHSPEGPWRDARKIATHAMKNNNNDFYNPMLHGEFMQKNGQIVYFEGTLVNTFSGNPNPTPWYDYNNIMYRVDLADPRLKLPEPPPGLSDAKVSPRGP